MSQRTEYMKQRGAKWTGTFDQIRETAKAVLLWDGTGRAEDDAVWVPKSQIESITSLPGSERSVEVEMSEWIAKEKGFI